MTDVPAGRATGSARTGLATAALALTAISAVALVVMIVLDLLDVEGFSSDNESSAAADFTWVCFSLGALLALVLGIIAWVRGRSRGLAGDVRAGQVAVGYFVLAVVVTAIAAAVTN
jgi:hypothetical protein